jgi:hypothetical protein
VKLNPLLLTAGPSPLKTFASLYERFQFDPKATTLHYQHASTTGSIGALIMGWEPDPKDKFPTGGEDRVNFLFRHKQHQTFATWVNGEVSAPHNLPNQAPYWIDSGDGADSDLRLTVQAEARCVVETQLGANATSTTAGSFWLHYRVKLFQEKFDVVSITQPKCGAWTDGEIDKASVTGGNAEFSGMSNADEEGYWPGHTTWKLGGNNGTGVRAGTNEWLCLCPSSELLNGPRAAYITVYLVGDAYDYKAATQLAPRVAANSYTGVLDVVAWVGTPDGEKIYFAPAVNNTTSGAQSTTIAAVTFFCKLQRSSYAQSDFEPFIVIENTFGLTSLSSCDLFIQEITLAEFDRRKAERHRLTQQANKLMEQMRKLENADKRDEKKRETTVSHDIVNNPRAPTGIGHGLQPTIGRREKQQFQDNQISLSIRKALAEGDVKRVDFEREALETESEVDASEQPVHPSQTPTKPTEAEIAAVVTHLLRNNGSINAPSTTRAV